MPRSRSSTARLQKLYFHMLWGFVLFSFAMSALYLSGEGKTIWNAYYAFYLTAALGSTWFTFVLLWIGDLRKRRYKAYRGQKISVIIPCYNEDPKLLQKAVASVVLAKGKKEIILIDDGSTNNIHATLRRLAKKYGVTLHFFDRNRGKRAAIHYAVKNLIKDSAFVVTMDSDTILNPDALVRIVEPLQHANIAASSGDVLLLNEKENLLTRMIGGYYWSALHIHRKAESVLGQVSCCSGALAAYRSSALKRVIHSFVTQEFFGERCTHSEDRHLTNLMHKNGYDVVFVPEAIAYTSTPSTLRKFLKQQQRWRRGFIQEAIVVLTYAWKTKPLLFLQTFLWELLLPLLAIGILVIVAALAISDPLFFLVGVLPSMVVVSFIRNLPALFEAPGKIVGLCLFALFSAFVTNIQTINALCTVRNKGWVTR